MHTYIRILRMANEKFTTAARRRFDFGKDLVEIFTILCFVSKFSIEKIARQRGVYTSK